jgi:hypothetical protein
MRRWGILLAGLLAGAAFAAPRADERFRWHLDEPWFGGFSAIEVTADGVGFIALSDRGTIVRGLLLRDAEGQISEVAVEAVERLRDVEGQPLRGRHNDSEGLALMADGRLFVGFEGVSRVREEGEVPRLLPREAAFDEFGRNAGFEALAVLPDGAVLAIPEEAEGEAFPVWRFAGGAWDVIFAIPRSDGFLPVGADVGPDGLLYVLERALTGPGFRSRVRVFGPEGDGVGATVFESRMGLYDNLEGIAVWDNADGIVMTLISDDNFNFFQQTELVEVRPAPDVLRAVAASRGAP